MKKVSIVVLWALVAVLALPITAPATPAKAQDTLTVLCTPQEDWCVAMTQAFEEETGIETN